MKKFWLPAVVYLLPLATLAAGLVPCGGRGEQMCDKDICFLLKLLDNVSDWFVAVAGIIVIILIIIGGLKMVISMGSLDAKTSARKFIATAIIGYAGILLAWVLVDTLLKLFMVDPSWGVWNPFSCGVPAP